MALYIVAAVDRAFRFSSKAIRKAFVSLADEPARLGKLRGGVSAIVNARWFERFIMLCIVLNTAALSTSVLGYF